MSRFIVNCQPHQDYCHNVLPGRKRYFHIMTIATLPRKRVDVVRVEWSPIIPLNQLIRDIFRQPETGVRGAGAHDYFQTISQRDCTIQTTKMIFSFRFIDQANSPANGWIWCRLHFTAFSSNCRIWPLGGSRLFPLDNSIAKFKANNRPVGVKDHRPRSGKGWQWNKVKTIVRKFFMKSLFFQNLW